MDKLSNEQLQRSAPEISVYASVTAGHKLRIIRDRQEIQMDLSRPDSDAALLQIRSGDQILIGRRGIRPLEVIGPVASTIAAAAAIVSIFSK